MAGSESNVASDVSGGDEVVRLGPRLRRKSIANFDNRRNEIVDLAASLFATNGYAATGIRDLGEAVGLARGALYYYIDSKEALLSEIQDRVLDSLLDRTCEICALDEPATSRLRKVSEVIIREVVERHDYVWVYLHEHRSLTGERQENFRRKQSEFEKHLIMLFSSGVADDEFDIADIRMTMLAFLGMHYHTYRWVRRSDYLDPTAVSTIYCAIFLDGIKRTTVARL